MYCHQAICLALAILVGFAAQNASAQVLGLNDAATISGAKSD